MATILMPSHPHNLLDKQLQTYCLIKEATSFLHQMSGFQFPSDPAQSMLKMFECLLRVLRTGRYT